MDNLYTQPASLLIQQRYSCRTYDPQPLGADAVEALESFIALINPGPFGNTCRFKLVSAAAAQGNLLRGLGTYGFIRDASSFLIGAVDSRAEHNLEDFGYLMEKVILKATDLGLGTCWLGGTFTKSSFGRKIAVRTGELVPAVAALGIPARSLRLLERMVRHGSGAERRLLWDSIFFQENLTHKLEKEQAGGYSHALEMVRLAPSASNKQPWRVVKRGPGWHFYLRRTPGYRESMLVRLFTVADLQRIDMGIAMCHFELSLKEAGLQGRWEREDPQVRKDLHGCEYIGSWIESLPGTEQASQQER